VDAGWEAGGGSAGKRGEEVIAARRVHAAHADAWEMEGRARSQDGGGTARVRGARLMASGLPDARWNNADIEAADADFDAVIAWYTSRAVPWGIRVPAGLTVDVGTPLFVKRCFALTAGSLTVGEVDLTIRVRRVGAAELARFAAVEAAVFDIPATVASRWIRPVLGTPGFAHWIAEHDDRPLAVATTVASAGDAGPAAMLTGLGSVPGAPLGVRPALARAAILSALERQPTAIIHTHTDPDDDPELYGQLGFTEVESLQVRLVTDR
jgi:hypothetical protein